MNQINSELSCSILPIESRLEALQNAGNNMYGLKETDIFLDMMGTSKNLNKTKFALIQKGTPEDSKEAHTSLHEAVNSLFLKKYFLKARQNTAFEHFLAEIFIKPGNVVPMNQHSIVLKTHITHLGGRVFTLFQGDEQFPGNMDIQRLYDLCEKEAGNIPFVRMEASAELLGGAPFSLKNLKEVKALCEEIKVPLILDMGALSDNLYVIHTLEESQKNRPLEEVIQEISSACDILYFSSSQAGVSHSGLLTNCKKRYEEFRELLLLHEGLLPSEGMTAQDMEMMEHFFLDLTDLSKISERPNTIKVMKKMFQDSSIPVLNISEGLGLHIHAGTFLQHIPLEWYPAASLASAFYLVSGIRTLPLGTLSEGRRLDGKEELSHQEYLRFTLPKHMTSSQMKYTTDRLLWLHNHRKIVRGLRFQEEPATLRFLTGKLIPSSNWQDKLLKQFYEDFGSYN